ncbi:MAG: MarR family transcriptional regulator [Paenibacillus sp.]|nr:MarR family transcriptional regulator [Paenibacillus sp.]
MEDVNNELQQVLRRILRKTLVYGKYVDPHFSGSQVAALEVIHLGGPMKVTRLAEHLSLSLSAVTVLSDKLIHNGYLKRERDVEDRRVVYLDVTLQGREILKTLLAREKELFSQWLSGLTIADREQFTQTFQHIIGNVRLMNINSKIEDSCSCKY